MKSIKNLCISATLFLTFVSPVFADFDKGVAAYDQFN